MKKFPIACVAGIAALLWGAGCGSDDESSGTTAPPSAESSTSLGATVTTAAGLTTTTAASSTVTAAPVTSAAATATTTGAGRVVTSPSDNVKIGDTGPGVEQIQAALKVAGYKIDVDGQFGPVTQRYVKEFQQKNSLTVDGVVGPKTWAKLGASGAGATTTTG